MKGIILPAIGAEVKYEEITTPKINSETDVLIKLNHAALNHRDVWIQKGQYAGIKLPAILGSDGCGRVIEVGSESLMHWINKSVIINAGHSWGNSPSHQSKDFSILGMPTNGTFAEYICVPSSMVHLKPKHLTDAESAALPLAGVTAYRALMSQGQAKPNQKVLITGIGGGVAQWVMQFALANKNEVWVTSGDADKILRATKYGCKGGVSYNAESWWKNLQNDAGDFDVIIDSACGDAFGRLIDLCKPGGKIVIYGGTAGNLNQIIPAKIFWKQISIIGSTMGSETDFTDMLQFINIHQIKPIISDVFELSQTQSALDKLASGKQFGKIVIKIAE